MSSNRTAQRLNRILAMLPWVIDNQKTVAEIAASAIDDAYLFATTVDLQGTEAMIGSELVVVPTPWSMQ